MNEPTTRTPLPHLGRARARRRRLRHAVLAMLAALAAGAFTGAAAAAAAGTPPAEDGTIDAALLDEIRALGETAGSSLAGRPARVEVEPGRLDPRLRLAPCDRIEAGLPPGAAAWGRARVVLRCAEGATRWTVYLPVTVKVWATAWVAAAPLASGTVLLPEHLKEADIDWAAERSPPVADVQNLVGRTLARNLQPGQAVRAVDVAQRQWFGAGDKVQVLARGAGFSVSGEAQALGVGIEGRPVRVRTDAGQVLTGMPIGVNRVEVPM